MHEDKLTHDERLRLECLAQAVAFASGSYTAVDVVASAQNFERYVAAPDTEAA